MSFDVSLVVEIVLELLLAATLVTCALLERRLSALRKDQAALGETVTTLNAGIIRAQALLAQLKGAAAEAGGALDRSTAGARALADELSMMIAAGERVAARIESGRVSTAAPAAAHAPIRMAASGAGRTAAAQLAESLRALR
jgi:hypothetical protein